MCIKPLTPKYPSPEEAAQTALNAFYDRLSPSSIFRLDVVHRDELHKKNPSEYHAYSGIIGHYSTLANAREAMNLHVDPLDSENIFAYIIKEIPVDCHLGEVSLLSVRSYNRDRTPNDECLEDQNLCNAFKGRPKEKIKHKIGDLVECLEGNHIFLGVVAALPPTPEDHFPILDAMDDCYLILPYSDDEAAHAHIPCTHVFAPSIEYPQDVINHLQHHLEAAKDKIVSGKSNNFKVNKQ